MNLQEKYTIPAVMPLFVDKRVQYGNIDALLYARQGGFIGR